MIRTTLLASATIVALSAGLGATPAQASAPPNFAVSSAVIQTADSPGSAVKQVRSPGAVTPRPMSPQHATPSETRNPIFGAAARAFIAGVKSIPGLFAKMLPAVKASLSRFVGWLRSAPNWIKNIISGLAVNAIWEHIKGALGL